MDPENQGSDRNNQDQFSASTSGQFAFEKYDFFLFFGKSTPAGFAGRPSSPAGTTLRASLDGRPSLSFRWRGNLRWRRSARLGLFSGAITSDRIGAERQRLISPLSDQMGPAAQSSIALWPGK